VTNVEIKHVDLDESMIRAIAAQAEAERNRRAKVIHAEGEFQASKRLAGAAQVLSSQPQALPLRFLQTLTDIASERNSHTIVFPVPLDLIRPLMDIATSKAPQSAAPPPAPSPEELPEALQPETGEEYRPPAPDVPESRVQT